MSCMSVYHVSVLVFKWMQVPKGVGCVCRCRKYCCLTVACTVHVRHVLGQETLTVAGVSARPSEYKHYTSIILTHIALH